MDYAIGKYKFDNQDEYKKALKEAEVIKLLRSRYDLKDIGTLKKILILVKQGKLSFTTEIGKDFLSELKDVYIDLSLISVPTDRSKESAAAPVTHSTVSTRGPAVSMPVNVQATSGRYNTDKTTSKQKSTQKIPEVAVFFYCYVPLIVIIVIILFSLVTMFQYVAIVEYVNPQFRNFIFVAMVIGLYLIGEPMMTILGIRYKKHEQEIKKKYLAARIRIPKKWFTLLVIAMIAIVIALIVRPFLRPTPSAQEKISFRNEVVR